MGPVCSAARECKTQFDLIIILKKSFVKIHVKFTKVQFVSQNRYFLTITTSAVDFQNYSQFFLQCIECFPMVSINEHKFCIDKFENYIS